MTLRIVTALLGASLLPFVAGSSNVNADKGGPHDQIDLQAVADIMIASRKLPGLCSAPINGQGLPSLQTQLASVLGPATLRAMAEASDPPLWPGLSPPALSSSVAGDEANAYLRQGMALAYGFNHAEAARSFRAAARRAPDCGLCYALNAWVLGPNINAPMDPSANEPAVALAQKAMANRTGASARDVALIEAIAARYSSDPADERVALDQAFADRMGTLAAQYPDDHDVQAIYAEALMDLQPWDYWEADKATGKGRTDQILTALEGVLAQDPRHYGAIHLYIHVVEASTTPTRAEAYADTLAAMALSAGHLVHMPSHIYYRIGRYKDSITTNIAASKADEDFIANAPASGLYSFGYYPHNVHFLMTSALMAGDQATALDTAGKLSGVVNMEVAKQAAFVQPIVAAPYFVHAHFSEPATIAAIPDPGDELIYVKAIWHFMQAIGAIEGGDIASAEAHRAAISRIHDEADLSALVNGNVPAPAVLDLAARLITGKIQWRQGEFEDAAASLQQAAAIQDTLTYTEPPYWYYPVRQTLGAVYLDVGQPEKAAAAYRGALADAPNNAVSLWGLSVALEKSGDTAGAQATRRLFDAAWAGDEGSPKLNRL